jgi:putative photosynthetic complex assembly protein
MTQIPIKSLRERAPFFLGVLVVSASLTLAVYGRMTGMAKPLVDPLAPTAERNLRFADRADGAVVITLADTGQVLDVATGQNGFLRGTMRGFARRRKESGIGFMPPIRLSGYADGRLVLFDPSTGRQVDLEAFGSLNEAVFARLLTMAPESQTASAVAQTASAGTQRGGI